MASRILGVIVLLATAAGCASAPRTGSSNTVVMPASDRFVLLCAPPSATSRVQPDPRHCSAGNVQTFTGDQLERTGATQVGDALHYLDPEITVTHH